AVDGHRRAAQFLGDPPHGQRIDALALDHGLGRSDHQVTRQARWTTRPAGAGGRVGYACRLRLPGYTCAGALADAAPSLASAAGRYVPKLHTLPSRSSAAYSRAP